MHGAGRAGAAWRAVLLAWLACMIVAGVVAPARAQGEDRPTAELTQSGAPIGRIVQGHGWIVHPETRRIGFPTTVLHLPPRGPSGDAGDGGAEGGQIVVALGLERAAERWAAWDARVYAALAPDRSVDAVGGWSWRVQAVTAIPFGRGWTYAGGRAESLASLAIAPGVAPAHADHTAVVLDFAASGLGPLAVLGQRPTGAGVGGASGDAWRDGVLMSWEARRWTVLPLPWQDGVETRAQPPGPAARVVLGGAAVGPVLLVMEPGEAGWTGRVWRTEIDAERARLVGPPRPAVWTALDVQPGPMLDEAARAEGHRIMTVPSPQVGGESLVLEFRDAAGLGLRVLSTGENEAELLHLARVEQAETVLGVTGMGPAGERPARVAMAWRDTDAANPERATLNVREWSIATGRELYAGPARNTIGLVTRQYQALAVLMVATLGMVLLFVLRPEARAGDGLPKGLRAAGPLSRTMSGAVDVVFGAMLASGLSGIGLGAILDLPGVLAGEHDLIGPLLALLMAAVHCTAGETIAGQSLGKMIVGSRVVSLRGRATPADAVGRATFVQVLVRNLIRWSVPLVGLAVLLDPDRRHAGDLTAGTSVVVEEEPDQSGGDGGDEP